MFFKNAYGKMRSKADNPYLGSLTIFVWVMPVSVLLFAIGVSEQQPALVLAALLSVCVAIFRHQVISNRTRLSALPVIVRRK